MRKYGGLSEFLAARSDGTWHPRFREIENVLGFALPASARRYPAWWANDPTASRHAAAWLSVGWMTEDLDLASERVSFRRERPSARPRSVRQPDTSVEELKLAPAGRLDAKMSLVWEYLGGVGRDASGKLAFPTSPSAPGLYRLRLIGESLSRHYVGEAASIRRRFQGYRTPGPTQATSQRIHALLVEHLQAGGLVQIDVAYRELELKLGQEARAVDLTCKQQRRLFEHAAIVQETLAEGVQVLNR
jgi:hypothetical protein